MTAAQMKQPPHAIEPEQMVLGGLMTDQGVAVKVFSILKPSDFYRVDHQELAAAIQSAHDDQRPHDYITLCDSLRDSGRLESSGGGSYIASLAVNCYSVSSIEHYAKIVKDKATRRSVISLCSDVSEAAYQGDSDDLAGLLSAGVESLLRGGGSKARKFTELLDPTAAYLKLARERRKAGGVMGAPTGLPSLDRSLGGIYGARVYGIAARPSAGKTALLNQIAVHAAGRGMPGLVMSLEMGAEELMVRALASKSRQNVTALFHGDAEASERAIEGAVELGDLPLWVDTDTYSLNAILGQIAVHKHRHGIQWVAIDHVGLIETERFNTRNDQIGHITRKLKQAAKQFDLPIIALFQLSRSSERENRQPGLHDLRDSGNIEQDLDVAMFLHIDPEERQKTSRRVKIGVLKNRNGRVGWLNEGFQFDGATQIFTEIQGGYQ